jgi:hypothetical protein
MIKNIKACTFSFSPVTYNASHFLQISTSNHGKKYKNPYVNKPKQKLSSTLFSKCLLHVSRQMVSKGVQARSGASDDELVDI